VVAVCVDIEVSGFSHARLVVSTIVRSVCISQLASADYKTSV